MPFHDVRALRPTFRPEPGVARRPGSARRRRSPSGLVADRIGSEGGVAPRKGMTQPGAQRVSRLGGALLLGSLLAGCAVHSTHDRETVSSDVLGRTGHALRPEPGTAPDLPEGVSARRRAERGRGRRDRPLEERGPRGHVGRDGPRQGRPRRGGPDQEPDLLAPLPLGPKQLEFTLTWPIETLWQRPRRVAAAQLDMARTSERLVQSGLDLVRDVRVAYADAVLDEERARLAGESRDVRERIAEIAEVQVRLGDISPLEAATVEVEAARARDEAQRASYAARSSRDRLRTLLGLTGIDRRPRSRPRSRDRPSWARSPTWTASWPRPSPHAPSCGRWSWRWRRRAPGPASPAPRS